MVELDGKKILVLGLGISGYAAADLLICKGVEVKISEVGDNDKIREYIGMLKGSGLIEWETGGHTPDFCRDADIVVTSPGIDIGQLYAAGILDRGIPVISELELGSLYCKAPIIAITGTNGKSTTTELIGNILSSTGRHVVVCGNIGNPLSGEINGMTEDSIAVVEVSSFQLERIETFKPYVAVLLNVAEDHYDRHDGFEDYKTQKFRIFANQTPEDHAVLFSDFANKLPSGEYIDEAVEKIKSKVHFYGEGDVEAFVEDGRIVDSSSGRKGAVLSAEENPLKGLHNLYNTACSVVVSRILGIKFSSIAEAIRAFKTLDHRFEHVGTYSGVEFIDDSKATNIDAARRALESIDKKTVLIAGGRDKGGDYRSILSVVKDKVKMMVLIGEASEKIKKAFCDDVPIMMANNLDDAVGRAVVSSKEGDTVLLSPMCSSFDMFSSYKERGDFFQKAVKKRFSGDQ